MLRKILKWTGIIVLSIVILLTVTVALRQNLKFDAPYPDIHASKDSSVIARGKYLVYGPAHCADCHSPASKQDSVNKGFEVTLSGGRLFALPVGNFYTRNITPDKETGIGKWTDQEIARTLRYGVKPSGAAVLDFMPFHNTSDEDLTAIISFLRTQTPIHNKVRDHEPNTLGYVIKAFLLKPTGPDGPVPVAVKHDTTAEYGKYITGAVANCRGCHTPRNLMTGAFEGKEFSGGMEIEGYKAVNLTPDPTGRLYGWTQDMFVKRFRQGRIIEKSPMPWGPFSRMSDTELKAIYKYLQTLEPVKNEVKQNVQLAEQ